MYIHLRLFDGSSNDKPVRYECPSISQSISQLKQDARVLFNIPEGDRIRLFFNGKEVI